VSLLLDTNAYVAFRQGNKRVLDLISASDGVQMSTIVLGELIYGFRNGSRYETNVESLRSFLAEPEVTVLPVSLTTADNYGSISAGLKARGSPIPTNDIWIAAHAMEFGAPVVSFDGHFRSVDGIELIDPGARPGD